MDVMMKASANASARQHDVLSKRMTLGLGTMYLPFPHAMLGVARRGKRAAGTDKVLARGEARACAAASR